MTSSTLITTKQALQFFEVFLIEKIRFTCDFEPNARTSGRMEAYQESLKALNTLMQRCKTESDPTGRADRSHVEALSH
jgi:hypothetical protein